MAHRIMLVVDWDHGKTRRFLEKIGGNPKYRVIEMSSMECGVDCPKHPDHVGGANEPVRQESTPVAVVEPIPLPGGYAPTNGNVSPSRGTFLGSVSLPAIGAGKRD